MTLVLFYSVKLIGTELNDGHARVHTHKTHTQDDRGINDNMFCMWHGCCEQTFPGF